MRLLFLFSTQILSTLGFLLPADVVPSHYDLALTFSVDTNQELPGLPFYGLVRIELTAVNPTNSIFLHTRGYNISERGVTISTPLMSFPVDNVAIIHEQEFLIVNLAKPLNVGQNYTLYIPFFGHIDDNPCGVYASSYYNNYDMIKEYLITTQFEPTFARRGFPCFDEPLFKATFRVIIGRPTSTLALSNMPLEKSIDVNYLEEYWQWDIIKRRFMVDEHYIWDHFEVTPRMSTYLVAFLVAPASFAKLGDAVEPRLNIWSRHDVTEQARYAFQIGSQALPFLERWFNTPFPLPKLDVIALPGLPVAAMENWGMIVVKESNLLYDSKDVSLLKKEDIAHVLIHKMVNQWFGDLVTMQWWSDIWLKEGFGTYLPVIILKHLVPTWSTELTFPAHSMANVLSFDSRVDSQPVAIPITGLDNIEKAVDSTSYYKASLIIRMLSIFLGDSVFRRGVSSYIRKYVYSNANQADLWRELTVSSRRHHTLGRDVTIEQIVDSWTKQAGYPLISVTRNYDHFSYTIWQKRFQGVTTYNLPPATWWVPLALISEAQKETRRSWKRSGEENMWLSPLDRSGKEMFHVAKPNEWILLNARMLAPCRVNYDTNNWQLLTTSLLEDPRSIPVLSRVQLLGDALEFAWVGLLNYTTAMELTSYLSKETDLLPLEAGLNSLSSIDTILKRSANYGTFQKFVRNLITGAYNMVGGVKGDPKEDHITRATKVLAVSWACRMQAPLCEKLADEIFEEFINYPSKPNVIPTEIRYTVCCVGIRLGNPGRFRVVMQRSHKTASPAVREDYLKALACSRDQWMLQWYLENSLDRTVIKQHEGLPLVIQRVAESPSGYLVARNFIYTRINDIVKAFPNHGDELRDVINALVSQFTTQRELDDFLIWQQKHANFEHVREVLAKGLETARRNIDWVERHQSNVIEAMKAIQETWPRARVVTKAEQPVIRANSDTGKDLLQLYKNSGQQLKVQFLYFVPLFIVILVLVL